VYSKIRYYIRYLVNNWGPDPQMEVHWTVVFPFVLVRLAIVLSVLLQYTDSDYLFGIFNLFLHRYSYMHTQYWCHSRGRRNRWPVASIFTVEPVKQNKDWPAGPVNILGPLGPATFVSSLFVISTLRFFEFVKKRSMMVFSLTGRRHDKFRIDENSLYAKKDVHSLITQCYAI
jgi:hypothetical protein